MTSCWISAIRRSSQQTILHKKWYHRKNIPSASSNNRMAEETKMKVNVAKAAENQSGVAGDLVVRDRVAVLLPKPRGCLHCAPNINP